MQKTLTIIAISLMLQPVSCMIMQDKSVDAKPNNVVASFHAFAEKMEQLKESIMNGLRETREEILINNEIIKQNFADIASKIKMNPNNKSINHIKKLVDQITLDNDDIFLQSNHDSMLNFGRSIASISNVPEELSNCNNEVIAQYRMFIAEKLLDRVKTLFDNNINNTDICDNLKKKAEYICYIVACNNDDRKLLLYGKYTNEFLNGDKRRMYDRLSEEDFWNSIVVLHTMVDTEAAIEIRNHRFAWDKFDYKPLEKS